MLLLLCFGQGTGKLALSKTRLGGDLGTGLWGSSFDCFSMMYHNGFSIVFNPRGSSFSTFHLPDRMSSAQRERSFL